MMNFKTVALLHPGNMGATIGAAAATSGVRVIWVSHQRSPATQDRANERVSSMSRISPMPFGKRGHSFGVSSGCCSDLARKVAEHNFKGLYVDANAVLEPRQRKSVRR